MTIGAAKKLADGEVLMGFSRGLFLYAVQRTFPRSGISLQIFPNYFSYDNTAITLLFTFKQVECIWIIWFVIRLSVDTKKDLFVEI